jgi:hypothetical protein
VKRLVKAPTLVVVMAGMAMSCVGSGSPATEAPATPGGTGGVESSPDASAASGSGGAIPDAAPPGNGDGSGPAPDAATPIVIGSGGAPGATGGLELAVAPGGDDAADGTLAHPFATLERARMAAQGALAAAPKGPVTIWIRGGIYERSATLELDAPDAGKPNAPVTWRGYPGEKARLVGGRRLDRAWLEPVTSASAVWSRLDPAARPNVKQVNLPAHGITDYGTLVKRGFGANGNAALELFIDGAPQTLARWPDASDTDRKAAFTTLATPTTVSFTYTGEQPARWSKPAEVWLHGYWGNDWADEHVPVTAIDAVNHTITLAEAPQYALKAGQPYYAENVLEELTVAGEFFLDRGTGMLYLWPPAGSTGDDTIVSMLTGPLVRLGKGASAITWRDLTVEDTRSTLIEVQGSQNVLANLLLRNAGTDTVLLQGSGNVVDGCEITGAGESGVTIGGGDRRSLTAAGNIVEMTHIHHYARWTWTYNPGITVGGVGNIARHNLIHDAPHAGILYNGNEHLIELNEIHDVCHSSSDMGAIYAGRDWGYRGNVIRHNFIHDIKTWQAGPGVHGVYLDDTLAGVRVEGNVIYNVSGAALRHGGGRDTILVNNVIAHCGTGLITDARGSQRIAKYDLISRLDAVGYLMEPWKSRYPECAAIPDSWDLISAPTALWLYPQGTVFSRNIGFANKAWVKETEMATHYFAEIKDDVPDQDPLFMNEATLDLTLGPESPALKIPGFQPIPFSSIGMKP